MSDARSGRGETREPPAAVRFFSAEKEPSKEATRTTRRCTTSRPWERHAAVASAASASALGPRDAHASKLPRSKSTSPAYAPVAASADGSCSRSVLGKSVIFGRNLAFFTEMCSAAAGST